MTDPRIEAAARAICKEFMKNGKALGAARLCTQDAFFNLAHVALTAADAAAHVRIVPMPIPADRIETAKNTLLCWKNGALTDEDAICMIVCGVAQTTAPGTITIPEVRNDRPIPEIGETHS